MSEEPKTNSVEIGMKSVFSADELKDWLERNGYGWDISHTGTLIECRVWQWPEARGRCRPQMPAPGSKSPPLAEMLWAAMGDAGLQGEFAKFAKAERWKAEPRWTRCITTDANGDVKRWSDPPIPGESKWTIPSSSGIRSQLISFGKTRCPNWKETLESRPGDGKGEE